MAGSIRDQMIGKGLVKKEDTVEARRAAEKAAPRAPAIEKSLPPPFEAAARGVVVESRGQVSAAQTCVDCGARLPPSQRTAPAPGPRRCAECAADHD